VRKVIDVYKQASSFSLSVTTTRRSIADQQVTKEVVLKFKLAAKSPDKLRMEADAASAAMFGLGLETEMVSVSNGRNSAAYFPQLNQYVVDNTEDSSSVVDSMRNTVLPPHGAKLEAENARLLREASIETDAGPTTCYVIEIPEEKEPGIYPQSYTWWVEKGSNKLLREDRRRVAPRGSDESITVYQTVKLDEPLPEELFVFTPPPGARKVEQPEP
jgi:outer membrane lipoprotein-sorting protein